MSESDREQPDKALPNFELIKYVNTLIKNRFSKIPINLEKIEILLSKEIFTEDLRK